MSGATGVAFSRPFCLADHVKALLLTVASSSSSGPHSNNRSASWCHHLRHRIPTAIRRKPDGLGFFGQRDGVAEFCRHAPNCLPMMPRSHVREGGADSESKGSNHPSESKSTLDNILHEPSLLLSLVQEIQPLDVSQISKEVSPDSTDAMKRTISGMLGLLPSDQFYVMVETSHDPLAKLLVSSMMTGYTLRNAEYRLCLQKSLEFSGDDEVGRREEESRVQVVHMEELKGALEPALHEGERVFIEGTDQGKQVVLEDAIDTLESLGPISDDVRLYIQYLKQKVASISKELEDCKQINTGLQVQSMVGEEKNDLLDYLRSLSPDKVAELSQPTSAEVEEVIEQVISRLLDNPATKLQHKETHGIGMSSKFSPPWEEDGTQKFSASPLQSQSALMVNRDHLARLLFWCMLLGHHMRGLEYRLELSRTLSLSGDVAAGSTDRNQYGS